MAKAIEQTKAGLTIGHAGLGYRGGVAGTVRQQVHDGDTLNVRALGNFGVRFLGVDAPEISFQLPGQTTFTSTGDPRWETELTGALSQTFKPALDPGLRQYLATVLTAGVAQNHYRHAAAAEDALEAEIQQDVDDEGVSEEDFKFFLAFAWEIMDRYGRMLCYINRDKESPPRPLSYNERMLEQAAVSPYFIWPNTDPFIKATSIADAVPRPSKATTWANKGALGKARKATRNARTNGLGVFDAADPLRLEAFELRFVSRRRPPDRWVIDLGVDSDALLKPQSYHTIARVEDRLFVPAEYLPLFKEAGWKPQP